MLPPLALLYTSLVSILLHKSDRVYILPPSLLSVTAFIMNLWGAGNAWIISILSILSILYTTILLYFSIKNKKIIESDMHPIDEN